MKVRSLFAMTFQPIVNYQVYVCPLLDLEEMLCGVYMPLLGMTYTLTFRQFITVVLLMHSGVLSYLLKPLWM